MLDLTCLWLQTLCFECAVPLIITQMCLCHKPHTKHLLEPPTCHEGFFFSAAVPFLITLLTSSGNTSTQTSATLLTPTPAI